MKTIYLVSGGEYSDYEVMALFSSRKLAEDYMLLKPSGWYNSIEEMELNPKV